MQHIVLRNGQVWQVIKMFECVLQLGLPINSKHHENMPIYF